MTSKEYHLPQGTRSQTHQQGLGPRESTGKTSFQTPQHEKNTLDDSIAKDERTFTKILLNKVKARLTVKLLKDMMKTNLVTNGVASFGENLRESMKNPTENDWKNEDVSRVVMRKKLADAKRTLKKEKHTEDKMKRTLRNKYGTDSRIVKKIFRNGGRTVEKN